MGRLTRGPTDARSKAAFPDLTLAGSWMLEPSVRAYFVSRLARAEGACGPAYNGRDRQSLRSIFGLTQEGVGLPRTLAGDNVRAISLV
jgi:hypothetical protein